MIFSITRSFIKLELYDKVVTIDGEALLPEEKSSPSYLVFSKSIKKWDKPFDHLQIDDSTKAEILKSVKEELEKKNIIIDIL